MNLTDGVEELQNKLQQSANSPEQSCKTYLILCSWINISKTVTETIGGIKWEPKHTLQTPVLFSVVQICWNLPHIILPAKQFFQDTLNQFPNSMSSE